MNLARFLLVTVAALQTIWFGEDWRWTVATLAVGAFVAGWLRPDDRCQCGAYEEDHADQGECPGGAQ